LSGQRPSREPAGARRQRRFLTRLQWQALGQTIGPFVLVTALVLWLTVHFVHPAPPRTLTIASGPKGATFYRVADKYRQILARNGVTLKVVETEGSLDNLNRLTLAHDAVDVALVQSGLTPVQGGENLVSLGSMFYEPLDIFYRASKRLERLSDLKGSRVAIGPEGSGGRALALALLKANGIEPGGSTTLLPINGEDARKALLAHQVEAIFLTGDSVPTSTLLEMLHTDGVYLYDFSRADAYVRRFPYLSKLAIPAGAFDLGEDLPHNEIFMVAPTVELLTQQNLHPALVDLLLEAALEVHAHASVLASAGQFPNPTTHAFPLDVEAARYYKTGDRGFTYRYLPFWLASLVNRLLVVLVPLLVVVLPSLRFLPQIYNWRVSSRLHKRYVELMALEREALGALTPERRKMLLERLDQIERAIIARGMPGSHAQHLYELREHLEFVRSQLNRAASASVAGGSEAPA
jgi:TRAP transporter TAXI family solute receptor